MWDIKVAAVDGMDMLHGQPLQEVLMCSYYSGFGAGSLHSIAGLQLLQLGPVLNIGCITQQLKNQIMLGWVEAGVSA